MAYSQEVADEICERVAVGEPLRQICRDAHMPGWVTVYNWINKYPEFAERMARARELGYDALAEECVDIADNADEDVKRSKLRVWSRLQLLSKWCPKKYGERTAMELTGADGGPVQISDTERAAKIAAILATAQKRKDDDVSDLL